jgi:RluA family pseudouridine synthase
MSHPKSIPLPDGGTLQVLYEDRSVLAVDKPSGWMLGPETEELAPRNLHLALMEGIDTQAWWAKSRGLKFVRFVHRLDAPTTGVLLLVKSRGAIAPFTRLFSQRNVEKVYLAVTAGIPKQNQWTCRASLGPDSRTWGRHSVDEAQGKPAETSFQLLATHDNQSLIAAYPYTGRTHQIRLHLELAGCPVVGDILYGRPHPHGLALRAVELRYQDPFTRRPVRIRAPMDDFCRRYEFEPPILPPQPRS